MRRLIAIGLVLCGLGAAGSRLEAQSKDERAVRALLDRAFQSANSVEEKALQQVLADTARSAGPFYPPFSASVASLPELERLLGEFLGQLSARSFATTGPVQVRVDKNNAWATYTWRAELTFKDGTRRSLEGRSTVTFVREGKSWKFAHGHSSLPATLPLTVSAREAEKQAILGLERSAWEALKNKQLAGWSNYFAEEASIFNESQAYRVRGRAEILRNLEAWLRQATLRSYQILDPQVQVVGDTALLTYYFTESGLEAGKEFSRAGKMSVVFVKQEGSWRALHEHRSTNP